MTVPPTLNSKLRVLVAKTYRAEKLYSSIRNQRSEKATNMGALAEMANDVRSREWERSHYQLRIVLNEVIGLGTNSAIIAEILQLRERFYLAANESNAALKSGTETLVENIKRQEFAHIFKLSLELVRHKARAQASKVIIDELSAVLDTTGNSAAIELSKKVTSEALSAAKVESPLPRAAEGNTRSNVIQLRPRYAIGGQGGGR